MTDQNPIVQRLAALQDQWCRFRDDPRARLLIWRATPDEATLIDAFVTRECDEGAARTPDLFVQLGPPFRSERAHGCALLLALSQHYEQALDSLEPTARALRWRCPSSDERACDRALLASALSSFRRAHVADDSSARLVVWLDPSDVSAPEAYLRWLCCLLQQTPTELRFMVVDNPAASTFAPLAEAAPECVTSQLCALDMQGAFASLAESAGGGGAGDQLRLLQTQLAIAVGAGSLPRAEQLAASATELASAQGCPQLAASLQLTLAAGYALASRHVDAHGAYSRAEQLARAHEAAQAEAHQAQGAPNGDALVNARQLHLHAKLGRAGVLLALCTYDRAAATYLDAATLAHSLAEARLELDSYRLASVCLGLAREPARAWQTGMLGLRLALGMDGDTRATSTLPYLADHLLRISETQSAYGAHHRPLAEQLTHLLGADWRAQLSSSLGKQ